MTVHFLTVHPGGHKSLTFAWRGYGYSKILLSNKAIARVCYGNASAASCGPEIRACKLRVKKYIICIFIQCRYYSGNRLWHERYASALQTP